jgi:hypothetical protein
LQAIFLGDLFHACARALLEVASEASVPPAGRHMAARAALAVLPKLKLLLSEACAATHWNMLESLK